MIIELKQKNKELFEANFEILQNNNQIGNINIKGKLGSMEVKATGVFSNQELELNYKGERNGQYRPYNITIDKKEIGEIYQCNKKTGLFSSYDYIELLYNSKKYIEYSIGLGKEGGKLPIYLNDEQIAQIDTEAIIYDDLYNYKLYIMNNENALIAIIIACYNYINACFEPGVKQEKSIYKNYSKTFDKYLISKYNSDWIKNVKE